MQHYRIRLLLWVFGVEPNAGRRVQKLGFGYPASDEMREAIPRQTMTLAATLQGVQPVPHRLCAECCDRVHVARNGVVIAIPTDHSPQPRALLGDRLMTLREQRPLHRLQLGPEPLTRCPPPHEEPSAL